MPIRLKLILLFEGSIKMKKEQKFCRLYENFLQNSNNLHWRQKALISFKYERIELK